MLEFETGSYKLYTTSEHPTAVWVENLKTGEQGYYGEFPTTPTLLDLEEEVAKPDFQDYVAMVFGKPEGLPEADWKAAVLKALEDYSGDRSGQALEIFGDIERAMQDRGGPEVDDVILIGASTVKRTAQAWYEVTSGDGRMRFSVVIKQRKPNLAKVGYMVESTS